MSALSITVVIGAYLFILFALMGAPVGRRSIVVSVVIRAPREKLWEAVWPLGRDAGWSQEIIDCRESGPDEATMRLIWDGRDGKPIERRVRFAGVETGRHFAMTVIDDTSLAQNFWSSYREETTLNDEGDAIRVVFRQSDRYRGLAFPIFRYFSMRREASKLKIWAETGAFAAGGIFEHPLTQVGFGLLSALLLWPLFGMSLAGLVFAVTLTTVIAVHELGHMAAFRMMGHRSARMIFIPLIGGIAIGGRPYDSRFEVAFSAMMGAGFSAFFVPIAIAGAGFAEKSGNAFVAASLTAFVACVAIFNLANLVPVGKFDGGQVLRQIFPGAVGLGMASFAMLSAFLGIGWMAGFPAQVLIIGGAVLAILSLSTAGGGVAPKTELKPISSRERFAAAAALVAIFLVHGAGALWAAGRFMS